MNKTLLLFLMALTISVAAKGKKDTYVEMQTSKGNMIIKLYNETPLHKENFLKLTKDHYYDSLLFHRVINEFMIQAGDPDSYHPQPGKSYGAGGPDYTIPAEFNDSLIHKKGALAAARTGDQMNPKKASSGSQFYIVQGRTVSEGELTQLAARAGKKYTDSQKEIYETIGGTPFLDGAYTVFGEVVKGLDVIDEIAKSPTLPGDRPKEDIFIITVKLLKKYKEK